MKHFPFYIAKRYLFSKKSTNVINVISGISFFGVIISTIALVIVLSIFNGLDTLIKSMFNSFDPDIKITLIEGKTFEPNQEITNRLKDLESIAVYSEIIEENALLRYSGNEFLATVKGVSDNYAKLNNIDDKIVDGSFSLKDERESFAIVGYAIASELSIGLHFIDPLVIYVPKRNSSANISLESSTNREIIYPGGIFSIQQDIDSRFVIVPIDFARKLFDYPNKISSIELRVNDGFDIDLTKKEIQEIIGPNFYIKDRFQQQELMYKTIKSEKLMGFIILAFILAIASFNIIGSLTMLIIDKKKDINTLTSLGTSHNDIKRIFLLEGWLISITGAFTGIIIGVILCFIQQYFGLIRLHGNGSFIVDSYPVEVQFPDLIIVFFTVVIIGYFAARFPVRYIKTLY